LVARNLNAKGLRSQLQARITKAIKLEQAKEEGRQDEIDENDKESMPSPKDDQKDDKRPKDKEVYYNYMIIKLMNNIKKLY
jgi:DNA-binding protein H-NS